MKLLFAIFTLSLFMIAQSFAGGYGQDKSTNNMGKGGGQGSMDTMCPGKGGGEITNEIEGTILSIDKSNNLVVLSTQMGTDTLRVDKNTQMVLGGKPDRKIGDLKKGSYVTADYEHRNGMKHAVLIHEPGQKKGNGTQDSNNRGGNGSNY